MDKSGEHLSAAGMYGGSLTAITVYGLQLSEIAAIVGALVAVVGAVAQILYLIQKNRRAEEIHKATLEGKIYGATEDADEPA